MWTYRATVIGWIDGDTVDLKVDLGFQVTITERFRILGIDTPEKNRYLSRVAGVAAQQFAETLAPSGTQLIIRTEKDDSFGRWLADVELPGGENFSNIMLKSGHAVQYSRSSTV